MRMIRTCSMPRSASKISTSRRVLIKQRIAPGQQDVGHLRVLGDVRQPGADVVGHLVVVVHEQPLAEAVAAVGAADLVAQQQHGVDVLVLHAAGDGHRALVAGVEPAPVVQLLLARDDQLPDRIVGIVPVDQLARSSRSRGRRTPRSPAAAARARPGGSRASDPGVGCTSRAVDLKPSTSWARSCACLPATRDERAPFRPL